MDLVNYSCPPVRQLLVKMGIAPKREVINSIEAIQLYFVSSGRNAWHKKWIKRYKPGSMNLSLASAKLYAERLRTNGSVFYIQVLPAVLLKTAQENYIVTQINTVTPLADYSCIAQNNKDWNGNLKHAKHLECYVLRGGEIDYALETFAPDSRHWVKRQPKKDSVMIFGPLNSEIQIEPLRMHDNPVFKSKSLGSNFNLIWVKNQRLTYSQGVESLIQQFCVEENDATSFENSELPSNVLPFNSKSKIQK